MVDEARLERVESGLAPVGEGWFVVNVADAAWLANEAFGARCVFEGDVPVLRGRPELGVHRFPQLGLALAVIAPGQPSGLYHAESRQEDFLVLAGQCVLVVEDRERLLSAWDFVHCPAGTAHAFVGAGTEPSVLLMVGARADERTIVYPRSEAALRRGAGVEAETGSASDAYAGYPHWHLARPEGRRPLPWAAIEPT